MKRERRAELGSPPEKCGTFVRLPGGGGMDSLLRGRVFVALRGWSFGDLSGELERARTVGVVSEN